MGIQPSQLDSPGHLRPAEIRPAPRSHDWIAAPSQAAPALGPGGAGCEDKLAQIDRRPRPTATVKLGMPAITAPIG